MRINYLKDLEHAIGIIVAGKTFPMDINILKGGLRDSLEPFAWKEIECQELFAILPDSIKSCWIFVLLKDRPSGAHFHPNSIQHMVMIEGIGLSTVGEHKKEMVLFDPEEDIPDKWLVIDKHIPHEFFPREKDMVVISFHTCSSDDLLEVRCDGKGSRTYIK